jgi:hypothetical protein
MHGMIKGPKAAVRLCIALLALTLCGCGYSAGVRLPEGYRTVGVTVFGNAGPEPHLERDFYESLSRQTSRMLDADLVAPDRAELVIRGQIVDFRRLYGVLSPDNELLQTGVRMTISAWIEDRSLEVRLGETLAFDQSVRYVVRTGEEQLGASHDAIEHIAQELLLDLFTQRSYETSGEDEPAEELIEPEPLEPRLEAEDGE